MDSSRPALEVADRNARLNSREIEWIEANAFDLAEGLRRSPGRRYDTIVLDPPAFAKSKSNLETALRGYKELNLRALKMLRPGGILVTCSCSYHVSPAEFLEVVLRFGPGCPPEIFAFSRSGARRRTIPFLFMCRKPNYLKCLIVSVSN